MYANDGSARLTWRDLQHIVVRTARKANLAADDWVKNAVGRLGTTILQLYTAMSVSVCPSVHSRISETVRPNVSRIFVHVAPRGSVLGGIAIRYVLPVLWMTSCF